MSLGLAYTSYAVRMLQGRDIMQSDAAALSARELVALAVGAGAEGCQIDLSQLDGHGRAGLRALREAIDEGGLFVELSIPAASLETRAAFDEAAATARALGARVARTALLMGRRYESFASMSDWQAFASHWRDRLTAIAPAIEDAGLRVGIENHKDWLAAELADLLDGIGSPALGACLDFGNNLALLEEPMAVAETLAPWVVTTHLKDMAVGPIADGFELAEVPLGEGLLPLEAMVAIVRRARPDARFLLEMITRDPLKVAIANAQYWVTRGSPDRAAGEALAATWLAASPATSLPRTTGLSRADAIALEDEHVRRSVAYARASLQL